VDRLIRRRFALGATAGALWIGGAAAQPTGAASNAAGPSLLEEFIVTAQKRSERVQDVPVAVTVLTAETLEDAAVSSVQRLAELDPNVALETAQSFQRNSLSIRGIGTIGNSRTFEGAVGTFIDGIYRSRTGMVLGDLLDIERIEILRGPQGTLFGKNTVAGALSLLSTRPEPNGFSGSLDARLGNFDAALVSGVANIPIGESSAARVGGIYHRRDGFFESPDTGDQYDTIDRYGVKAQLLFEPSNSLEVRVIADMARSDSNCCWSAAIAVNGPTAPLIGVYGTLNGLTFVPAPEAERDRAESLNSASREAIEDDGLTARVTWQLPRFTLTSITGVRNWSHEQIEADADFSPADLFVLGEPASIDGFSEELTLTIPFGRTDLLLGLYYSSEDYESVRSVKTGSDADNYLNALISANLGAVACVPPVVAADCAFPVGIAALLQDGDFARESYDQRAYHRAWFVHSSTTITDRFGLTAGLRHSVDDKSGGMDNLYWYDSAIARAVLASMGVPDDGTPRNGLDLIGTFYGPSFHVDDRNETTTGTLSLQFRIASNAMLYGGYQRGYKAGGVNLFREGAITDMTYDPEYADGLEIGVKVDYAQGRARTNVALFETDFTDLQINFFTGLEFRTENTGDATTRGVEIENAFQLSDALRVDASLTWLKSRFGDLTNPLLTYLDHRATPKAPEWDGTASVAYERPLRNGMTFLTRGLVSYTGKHFVGAEVPTEQEAGAYLLTELDIGIRNRGGLELGLWCTNCGDQDYRTVYFNSTFQPGSYSVYLNAPREYGIRVSASL
jgi:iron complex outermembrane receptor protein